jgi:purine-nucleoside phosphorylase
MRTLTRPVRGGTSMALVRKACRQIQDIAPLRPRLAIILGTGFGHVCAAVKFKARLAYARIPGFPTVSVTGHAGEVVVGLLENLPVIVLSGRAHYYEGNSIESVTFAVRVLAACGVSDLLLTNAAGAIRRSFRPGDFMMLEDHINFMGWNPLRGPVVPGQQRFVDLTDVYDAGLRRCLRRAARSSGVRLHSGVYLAVSGPSYETPAEIRAFERLGADAVGMSTVPEAIVARQCGMRVAAVSCVTNFAAGRAGGPLSHAEVLVTAQRNESSAVKLLQAFAKNHAKAFHK